MLNVFKNPDYQLVVETTDYGDLIFKIENRYGVAPELDLEVEIQTHDDMLRIYNQIGKLLGYPEMKNNA